MDRLIITMGYIFYSKESFLKTSRKGLKHQISLGLGAHSSIIKKTLVNLESGKEISDVQKEARTKSCGDEQSGLKFDERTGRRGDILIVFALSRRTAIAISNFALYNSR